MTHIYELRKFEDDGSINTVLKISGEPKDAKREAKSYAEQIPGLYSLYKVEKVALFFTEKEVDKND